MIKRVLIGLCILVLFLAACAPAATQSAPQASDSFSGSREAGAPPSAPEPGKAVASNAVSDVTTNAGPDRLVIRNADLSIVVKDPAQSMDAIAKLAKDMGGFTVTSNLYKSTNRSGASIPQANITVRVPADKLDEALGKIKAMVQNKDTDILNESVSGQDVTKEYTDLNSRLTNLQNAEKQLQNIMDEATKTEDVLNVYNQLVSIREQIEVLKGQIKYYEDSAALSAIAVTLQSTGAVEPLSIGGWRPVGVARDALQTTLDGLRFLANAAIWLVLFVLPIGAILYFFVRLVIWVFRKLRKGRKASPPAPLTPPPA